MAEQGADGCVLMFVKDPQPGKVKTRMVPRLGEAGAAALARHLAETVGDCLQRGAQWPVVVCTDNPDSEWCQRFAKTRQFTLMAQGEGSLGDRMHRCAKRALETHQKVIIVGSDCDGYDPLYLAAARSALAHHDVVIGPARDGGYVLIGVTRLPKALFDDIAWGTDRVFAAQCRQFELLGIRYKTLPMRQDIDVPADLEHLEGPPPFGGDPFSSKRDRIRR